MGTRAKVKLQTSPGDAICMYTTHDGKNANILEWGSNLDKKWEDAVSHMQALINGNECVYPMLTRWCKETSDFLKSPHSLEKYGNLIIGQSLGHLHHHHLDLNDIECIKGFLYIPENISFMYQNRHDHIAQQRLLPLLDIHIQKHKLLSTAIHSTDSPSQKTYAL